MWVSAGRSSVAPHLFYLILKWCIWSVRLQLTICVCQKKTPTARWFSTTLACLKVKRIVFKTDSCGSFAEPGPSVKAHCLRGLEAMSEMIRGLKLWIQVDSVGFQQFFCCGFPFRLPAAGTSQMTYIVFKNRRTPQGHTAAHCPVDVVSNVTATPLWLFLVRGADLNILKENVKTKCRSAGRHEQSCPGYAIYNVALLHIWRRSGEVLVDGTVVLNLIWVLSESSAMSLTRKPSLRRGVMKAMVISHMFFIFSPL